MTEAREFIKKVSNDVSVWAIIHHGAIVGNIVVKGTKSRVNGWNVKLAVTIYCGLMNKEKSLEVLGKAGGCGIDLVSCTMQDIMRKHADEFREYGIMVPTDYSDPILEGRGIYEFLFNEWQKLFELGGYKLNQIL